MPNSKDPISIAITLGKGAVAAVTEGNNLIIEQGDLRIDLGRATVWKFESIIEIFGRLKIHAVDYKRKEN